MYMCVQNCGGTDLLGDTDRSSDVFLNFDIYSVL